MRRSKLIKEKKTREVGKVKQKVYKMVILLYYYDYYYYSLFKKHTFISKKRIKPKHYNRWVNCLHTHKHSTINVELLLAALRAKTRTIVNLKLLQRVALLFFLPANSLTHPSGRTQKISANVKGAFLLPSRMGTDGGNYQWSKWPLK